MNIPLILPPQHTADQSLTLNNLIKQINAALAVGGGSGSGAPAVDITQTWEANIAALGLSSGVGVSNSASIAFDHLFGTAQVATDGQKVIANAADLAANGWSPYQPFPANGGYAKINGQPEIYMPFNRTGNFSFKTDRLELTATIDAGQTCTPTVVARSDSGGAGVTLTGGATTIANLGLGATTGIVIGQLVGIPQKNGTLTGLYQVTALNPGVSVTITAVTGLGTDTTAIPADNRAIIFLPYYAYVCSSTSNPDSGHTLLNFVGSTIPAGVIVGMIATQLGGGAANGWDFIQPRPYVDGATVTAVVTGSNGSVTVTPAVDSGLTLTSGQIVFGPMIRSAAMFNLALANCMVPGRGGVRVVAGECVLKVPSMNGYSPPGTGITQAQFNAIPSTAPVGSWPADWMFSNYNFDVAAGRSGQYDTSELDIFEINVGENTGNKQVNVTPHGSNTNQTNNETAHWYPITSTYPLGGQSSSGQFQFNIVSFNALDMGDGNYHKSQFIWTPTMFYWFIDGFCIKYSQYNWTSIDPPWQGMDLDCGALAGNTIAANMVYPINTAGFPMVYAIQRKRLLRG